EPTPEPTPKQEKPQKMPPNVYKSKLLYCFYYVLQSAKILNEKGVIHFDIKERNIYLKSLGSKVEMIEGDSHSDEVKSRVDSILFEGELDFLFIDGDHTYEGVKKDYNDYKKYVKNGGWIGFHDIKDTEFHRKANCRVDLLWKELEGEKIEFIDYSSNFGGIGFIQKN
ncbi:MAG: class I SAM-dependent methyltransferase, partial [Spirochaetia bacterium]|nr:class I SAM-dependent methyltransferase [Spirochaetia bacterium]